MNTFNVSDDLIWGVREIEDSSDKLLDLLDKKELYLPRLQQIVSEERKREWLTVRILLKELLGEENEILYTEAGRPYLSDNSYQISISHTKGYVAAALSKKNKVGIDIEYVSPRIKKISSRFMNNEEIESVSMENEIIHLLLHWSAKESMFKALNKQEVDFRECLHIKPFMPQLNIFSSFEAFETRTKNQCNFQIHYLAKEDYVLTVTSLVF